MQKVLCIYCNSKNIIKKGKRNNKFQIFQKYFCKFCNKNFTLNNIKNKTYLPNIILNTISYYNLGNTLKNCSVYINKNYNLTISQQTINSWLKKFKEQIPYFRLRKQCKKLYPKNIIFNKRLLHQQLYLFQYHKAKLDLLTNEKYLRIKQYLQKIPTNQFTHHIFENNITNNLTQLSRISKLKIDKLPIQKIQKNNKANALAKLALNLAKDNKGRHLAIQKFMLINDSVTIATEIPVYLTNDDIIYFKNKNFIVDLNEYKTPIIGHIDILQIRNNLIHILDYKPNSSKIQAIEQLTLYALSLASRTQLPLSYFKCAWFDENNYYEFFPLHVVYNKTI
jgi:transposase-like protein